MITIYGKQGCPFCDAATSLCQTLGVKYEYINIFSSPETEKKYKILSQKYSHFTVPLILVDDKFIGGFTALQKAQKAEELESLKKIS
jgi:glutaredoxin